MFPNRAGNLPTGMTLDEDVDENEGLKEFYMRNLSYFFTCHMNLVSYSILKTIAATLFATNSCPEDWRIYAEEMEINNDTIDEIALSASGLGQPPILFAMQRVIRKNGTFGNIIHALLKTGRFDVLRKIESFARSLLPMPCESENDSEKHSTFKDISASFSEQKCDLNSFQQRPINVLRKDLQVSDPIKFPEKSSEEIKIPTAPDAEKLTALILHAESENSVAEQLAEELGREDVSAITLTQVDILTQYSSERVLSEIFNQVDFIVPIVSKRFMEEIYPENYDQFLESDHVQSNSYLFKLCETEYKKNRFINFRVRPVIVPGMSRRLINEPILSYSFRLDKEVPKLIKVLKETKSLNALQLVK